jgi:hypothetical protein
MIAIKRRQKNTKHRNRDCSSEDWRGKRCQSCPGRFSTLSDVNTIITAMKREWSTSGLWVCGSSLSYFSLVLHCLDIIWATQHDYGAYYIIPMWWIFILLDDWWDVVCYYVLDGWADAYYHLVLYYLFWSNMYARACEGRGVNGSDQIGFCLYHILYHVFLLDSQRRG